jgi:hypothetical protein
MHAKYAAPRKWNRNPLAAEDDIKMPRLSVTGNRQSMLNISAELCRSKNTEIFQIASVRQGVLGEYR